MPKAQYRTLYRVIGVLEAEGVRFTDGGVHLQRPAPVGTVLLQQWSRYMNASELTNRIFDVVGGAGSDGRCRRRAVLAFGSKMLKYKRQVLALRGLSGHEQYCFGTPNSGRSCARRANA